MPEPQRGISSTGKKMHYSAGAVIQQQGKFLLIDRVHFPHGFAGPAGHIDEGETPEQAVKREVKEETGLQVTSMKLLYEGERDESVCAHGGETHYWYLYECDATGKVKLDTEEAKSINWYSPEEIKKLKLEPVWNYWFKKLKVI